jgi:trehalose 6-phosphate synthase
VWAGGERASELPELGRTLDWFARVDGTRLEPKSMSVCLHWRLVDPELKSALIARAELACDEWLERNTDFERIAVVEGLEVRRRSANKSIAVAWLRQRRPMARLIAIGDDRTDEDMFAALHDDELAIGVGCRRPSRSMCRLSGPTEVRAFLAWLVDMRTGGTPRPFIELECRSPRAATARAELLVVSNRTPPPIDSKRSNVGGLVSALEPALRARSGMWLGWSGHEAAGDRQLIVEDETRPSRASFDLSPEWREHFYGGLCNRALWPLFHNFPGRARFTDRDWRAYVDANAEFARHAYELVRADGMVWAHDYHLLLIGHALRQRGFRGPIGIFVHTPFPSEDLLETLPWADEIIQAMLAFDLIGFHTEHWAENFRACAKRRFGFRSLPDIAVLPIGVDPAEFGVQDGPADPEVAALAATLRHRRLILGVDRLDYAKGVPERLLALERLFEIKPEWCGRISFVQISVPSREDVPEYAELRDRVEQLVGRINGRFGEADWVPVRYLYRSFSHEVLAQLYRTADIALVTPLRDGLNLVAKEFVVAQLADNPGVLVLSRFAGAAEELRDAVLTNPYHVDGMAGDIDRALRMQPAERLRRHDLLRATLANRTPQRWASAFLDRLRATASPT